MYEKKPRPVQFLTPRNLTVSLRPRNPIIDTVACCARAASGHAAAAPSSVTNWRRLMSSMGSSPEPAVPAYRRLRMLRKRPQVLGVDLNRSESRIAFRALDLCHLFVDPGYRYVASPSSNATRRHREHGGAAHTFASAAQQRRFPEPFVREIEERFGDCLDTDHSAGRGNGMSGIVAGKQPNEAERVHRGERAPRRGLDCRPNGRAEPHR